MRTSMEMISALTLDTDLLMFTSGDPSVIELPLSSISVLMLSMSSISWARNLDLSATPTLALKIRSLGLCTLPGWHVTQCNSNVPVCIVLWSVQELETVAYIHLVGAQAESSCISLC